MSPDTAGLARLHALCFSTPRPWAAHEFAQLLGDPANFLLREPSGFLLGRVILDEAEVLTLAVDPDARRQGTGRVLMARFEAEALLRKAANAFLEVAADNDAAINLYLAAGFRLTGRRPRYYRAPDGSSKDAEIMGKPLG
ncbi:GNAT family N-acetyltransferase [Pseudooceanicola sp. CBS1P-1]|uniref:GNAT family N-acetyltransferase n=1 Tax=Pseudooceanicola albus TaxID=2692189 RepID=A0A6L7G210_9RHOB|nr:MULTISPECIES: GNAT family N-acetyltransferase [Pseudooceanicola]MBT9384703.1 GNAT family N-acetyltransferase [Pseudooceanicola endophyticus]MXN18404.1 GNAT family N-acetyltransferase [Pseudooceanicola albus]